jgi:adenylate cyclase
MRCAKCNTDNEPARRSCIACGEAMGRLCLSCQSVNPSSSRFCGQCGRPLDAQQAATPEYLPDDGELKQITILFADVSGSTSLIESLDPEEAHRKLAPVLEAMKDAVRRFDGAVVRAQGDGIMAVFGAPVLQEDHAVRACCAALALQEAVKALPGNIPVRVGIHSGEVLARTAAVDFSTYFDTTGVAVHIASRLQTLAPPGGIALSAATERGARPYIVVETQGQREIRGLSAPLEVFLLTRLQTGATSQRFLNQRERSDFIGRDLELALLERGLQRASDGDGCVVGLVAEAGVGKSRLCFEFAEHCRKRGVPVHEGRALAHSRATPFLPIVEIVRALCQVEADDSREQASEKVRRWLETVQAGLSSELPLLLDFLGLGAASERPKIDPTANRERLNTLFYRLVRSAAAQRPRVFLLEDLHWMDSGSESLIEVIVEALHGTQVLLVVNYRPGYSAPWMRGPRFEQLSLGPLPLAAADSLAARLLGQEEAVLQLLPLIADRARGNPLFIEELVRAFQESGCLSGEQGAYHLVRNPDMHRVPETVQAIIGARIDSRPEADKRMLQAAAVIGREFSVPLLSGLTGATEIDIRAALRRLSEAGLISAIAVDDGEFSFRHPMIQDVAYRSLLSDRRRELHGSVAGELEKGLPDANGAQAGFLAYHWEEAGNAMKAATFNMKAAGWHGTRDPTQAIDAWKRVRRLLLGMGLQGQARYPLAMANGQIINLGWREGMTAADVAPLYDEALDIARSLGDMRAVTLLTLAYGRALGATGSAADYVATATNVLGQLDEQRDASLKVVGSAVLCHAMRHAGSLAKALEANDAALNSLGQVSEVDQQTLGFDVGVWVKGMRAQILTMMDRCAEAQSLVDELIAGDESTVDVLHRMMAHFTQIDIAWSSGDAELATPHAAAVAKLAERGGTPYLRVYGQAYVGLAQALRREYAAAAGTMTDNLAYARQRNAGLDNEPRMLADLAYVQLCAGLVARSRETAEEAASVARRRGAQVWLAYAHLLIDGPNSPSFAELADATGAKLLRRIPLPRA